MSVLDSKNLTPRILSSFTALIISAVNALVSLILDPVWYVPLLVFVLTFILTYYLYYYTLQRFIYRKIKIIHKLIYQTKATRKEAFFYDTILPQKSLEEVSQDVARWAMKRREEIDVLRANEKFRKEFLSNLAHELRTPVFTVQGYVETLLNGAINDPEVNMKFLTNASRGVDRLARLVDDLSKISQLESGNTLIVPENFVIQHLIQEVFDELFLKASEKNIKFSYKKGTEAPLEVYADKEKIKQVLINLAENAIKYGHENGLITAGCYLVDEKNIYVEISDNGPGIDSEHLPRLFERFYRADKSRSRSIGGGTGLGLAIVKHIVEAHGQTVNVRSKKDVGSSFGFTLSKGRN